MTHRPFSLVSTTLDKMILCFRMFDARNRVLRSIFYWIFGMIRFIQNMWRLECVFYWSDHKVTDLESTVPRDSLTFLSC